MDRVIINKHCVDSLGRIPQYDLNLHILGIREAHLVLKESFCSSPSSTLYRRFYQDIHPLVTLTFDMLTGSFVGKRPRDAIIVSHNQQL